MNELKPCPFCGSYAVSANWKIFDGPPRELKGKVFWQVECQHCRCRTGMHFEEDAKYYNGVVGEERAVASWNTRSTDNKEK